jgi:hypothetical protein
MALVLCVATGSSVLLSSKGFVRASAVTGAAACMRGQSMSDKKSAADILAVLGERVRLIEHEAAKIAAVIEQMADRIKSKSAAAPEPERQG